MGVLKLDRDSKRRLKKACSQLKDKTSLIALCPHEHLTEIKVEFMRELLGKYSNGVYVSLNQPYNSINLLYSKSGLKTSGIHYIDCITSLVSPGKVDKKNPKVFHVSSPAIIAEEGLLPREIDSFIDKLKNPKFIVMDTLRTLVLYNKPGTISKFMQHVLNTARKINAKVVVLTITHEEDKVTENVLPLFDVILKLRN